jgi:carbonic anhydrase
MYIFTLIRCTKHKQINEIDEATLRSEQIIVKNAQEAIIELKNGNKRFLEDKLINYNYKRQIELSKGRQKPYAIILSCMDSRVPPEIVFDQGIGHLFALRVAGNVEDENILGSLEYAVEHGHSKVIVVMGHSHCGAVKGSIIGTKLENLTQLLEQIKPSIKAYPGTLDIVEAVSKNNVKTTIQDILKRSNFINEHVNDNKIDIVGAYYNIETGEVSFLE